MKEYTLAAAGGAVEVVVAGHPLGTGPAPSKLNGTFSGKPPVRCVLENAMLGFLSLTSHSLKTPMVPHRDDLES